MVLWTLLNRIKCCLFCNMAQNVVCKKVLKELGVHSCCWRSLPNSLLPMNFVFSSSYNICHLFQVICFCTFSACDHLLLSRSLYFCFFTAAVTCMSISPFSSEQDNALSSLPVGMLTKFLYWWNTRPMLLLDHLRRSLWLKAKCSVFGFLIE